MSKATTNLGLIKGEEGESYDNGITNNNWDAVDAAMSFIDFVDSTKMDANWDFRASQFTRYRVGTKGIIVAEIIGTVLKSVDLPNHNSSNLTIDGVIPVGFRPSITQNNMPAIVSGLGRGDDIQVILNGAGGVGLRSSTTATYPTSVGTLFAFNLTYRWDGKLT